MVDVVGLFAARPWPHLIAALLHTLWQGAILALLLSLALRKLPAARCEIRYVLSLFAQLGVLLAGLLTWSILEYEPGPSPAPAMRMDQPPAAASSSRSPSSTVTAARPTTAPGSEDEERPWSSILAVAWLGGVAVMLGRTAGSVWSASRLSRGPRVGDPAVLAMVGRIRDDLGIGRAIRVVEVGERSGPAVLGIIWPTLLLPASAMTGLPPEMLRAILIHELAHIRRHDYLVDLVQRVVESVLYFNPAVWWLGRQARLEREACCDAAAVRLTGQPLEYSRSLAEWAGRARGAAIAAAWGGDRRPGTLLERVRRVLRPGDRPSARVSTSGLVLLLVGGPLLLTILWRGTDAAVGLAAQILSPAERIHRIEAARAEYAPPVATPEGKGTLRGTIRTADGRPPARPITLYHRTDRPGGSGTMGTLEQSRGEFSVEVPSGTTWLAVTPDDYAPAVVGPFELTPGRTIDGIRMVLEPGHPAKIAVTDEQGQPVAGARIFAQIVIDGRGSIGASNGWVSDRDGVATIPHAVERPHDVYAQARGYEPMSPVKMTPSFERAQSLTLKTARPARGIVVDANGRPVAGAELRVYREESDDEGGFVENYSRGTPMATTDVDGRFVLDALRSRTSYLFYLDSKGAGRGISPRVRAGQEGVRMTIGPKWAIRGTILPGRDANGRVSMPETIDLVQRHRVGPAGAPASGIRRPILVDREGHFAIADPLPCETMLEVAGRKVRVEPDRPETTVTIDLSHPDTAVATRRVVLRFTTPDGVSPPSGTIEVDARRPDDRDPAPPREWTLKEGRVTLDAPVPGRVFYQMKSVVGYWFNDATVDVKPGEGEQVVEVPMMPAGAIAGQVLDVDGRPAARGANILCRTVDAVPGPPGQISITRGFPVDANGRFFASPLPMGGSYAVSASCGHNQQPGPTVTIDGANPTRRVTIRMSRTATAEGRVVGPDGRPLAGIPVKLEFAHPTARMSWMPPTRTDDAGQFRFDDLNAEIAGYRATAEPLDQYQPGQADLRPGGPSAEIRLVRGHAIAGRVVDAKTGWPIPGVVLYAHRPNWVAGERYAYEAGGQTDEAGRFRFGNLPEGTWTLNDRNGLDWASPDKTHGFGVDGPEPIEIRATLPAWSDLKPRLPEGR